VATKNGYTSDSDSLEVPERVDDLAKLRTVIVPIASTSQSITVNVSVLDALPQAGSYINLSYSSVGIPDVTPAGQVILSASEASQFVITRPNFGSGTGRVNFTATASLRVNDTDSVDVPERSINSISAATATITLGTVTSGSNNITIPYTFSAISSAEQVQVFTQESSGSAPTVASVEFTGTRFTSIYRNDGRSQITIPIAQPSNYVLVTFVPFDFLNRRGTVFTNRYQALSAALTPPDGFQSATNLSTGSTFVSNSVQMPASNLPDKIRVELFGATFGSDITRTAGASASQTVVHTGLNPESSYTWQYYPVNNNGAVGAGSDFVITETAAGPQLDVPIFTYDAQDLGGGNWRIYFNILNQGDYPETVAFEGEVFDNNVISIGDTVPSSQFEHFWPTTAPDSGYARFRAVATGYTTSDFSLEQFWSTGGIQPF
jgi:hypothetical protein